MECLLYISSVNSQELSCFLTVFYTRLALNLRLGQGQALYFLLYCVCFAQSVNKYGVNSRSLAVFLFYVHLFVLDITKETQQDKSELKRS